MELTVNEENFILLCNALDFPVPDSDAYQIEFSDKEVRYEGMKDHRWWLKWWSDGQRYCSCLDNHYGDYMTMEYWFTWYDEEGRKFSQKRTQVDKRKLEDVGMIRDVIAKKLTVNKENFIQLCHALDIPTPGSDASQTEFHYDAYDRFLKAQVWCLRWYDDSHKNRIHLCNFKDCVEMYYFSERNDVDGRQIDSRKIMRVNDDQLEAVGMLKNMEVSQ